MDRWLHSAGAKINGDDGTSGTQPGGTGPPRKTIALVWSEIRNVYDATKRDFVYAYGESERLVHINALYEQLVSTPCKIVIVTHSEHSALLFYLNNAERLARQHGVIIFSMCWLRRSDDMHRVIEREELRRFRAQITRLYKQEQHGDCDDDDDDDSAVMGENSGGGGGGGGGDNGAYDVIDTCTDLSKYQFPIFDDVQSSDFNYGDAQLHINNFPKVAIVDKQELSDDDEEDDCTVRARAQKRAALAASEEFEQISKKFKGLFGESTSVVHSAVAPRTTPPSSRNNIKEQEDASAAAESLTTDDMLETGYAANNAATDVIKAMYYLHDNDKCDRACNLRNLVLLQFFGKFLYYAREFVICDHTGMAFHKSFRLIDPYVIKQLCRAAAITSPHDYTLYEYKNNTQV